MIRTLQASSQASLVDSGYFLFSCLFFLGPIGFVWFLGVNQGVVFSDFHHWAGRWESMEFDSRCI